jgi:SAM-dependent methyltransferase
MFSPPDYDAPETFLRPRFGPWTIEIYLHRKPILDSVKEAAPYLGGVLLDVGCGRKPYATLLNCTQHIGIDVATSMHPRDSFDQIYDGIKIPFLASEFDSVLCTEVLEHCREPRAVVLEIARVLRVGGYALITAPMFIHHHEAPNDFQRLTQYGMEELASQAALEVVWIKPRGGPYSTMVCAIVIAISQTLSLRPVIDIVWWAFWPIAAILLWLEGMRDRSNVISLGWQMLVTKPTS